MEQGFSVWGMLWVLAASFVVPSGAFLEIAGGVDRKRQEIREEVLLPLPDGTDDVKKA